MKTFIISGALVILCTAFLLFQDDHDRHERMLFNLKFAAEEAAAAGAQYADPVQYAEGKLVFDRTEGTKAAEYEIRQLLHLDERFDPLPGHVLKERVRFWIEFYDDGNTSFPYHYEDPYSHLKLTLTDATVIVRLNEGKALYRLQSDAPDLYRIAAHTWQQR